MKKVITALCCLGIFLSSLTFGVSLCGKSFVADALVETAIHEVDLESSIRDVLLSSDLNVSDATSAKLQEISKKVAEDKQVKEATREFVTIAVNDIITGQTKGDGKALNKEIRNKTLSYAGEISSLTNHLVSEEAVKNIISEKMSNNNLEQYYSSLMKLTRMDATEDQKGLLSVMDTLQGNPMFYGSLAIIVILSAVILLLNREGLTGLLPLGIVFIISAIATLLMSFLFKTFMGLVMEEVNTTAQIGVDVSLLYITAGVYAIIAAACFVTRSITNKRQVV